MTSKINEIIVNEDGTSTTLLHTALESGDLSACMDLMSKGAILYGPSATRVLNNGHNNTLTPLDTLSEHLASNLLNYQPHFLSLPAARQWETTLPPISPVLSSGGSLAITPLANGNVLSYGVADFQLGYPLPSSKVYATTSPQRIESLASHNTTLVTAATYHTMSLTSTGVVYSWGHNKNGRLGVGDEEARVSPTLIPTLLNKIVVCIAAAVNHSLCCTSSGEVYSWGSNRFGQCGFSSTASVSPRLIPNLKRQHIQAVACASQHSVAVNALGEVYTWGSNSHAQLGHGATASAPIKPGRVMTLNNSREGKKRVVFAVAASDTSTTVLARKESNAMSFGCGFMMPTNNVYVWGNGCSAVSRIKFESKAAQMQTSSDFTTTTDLVNIVAISCARTHSVAVSDGGQVYLWGSNTDVSPPISPPPATQSPTSPRLVEGVHDAVSCSASESRIAIVTKSGDLWQWGASERNHTFAKDGVRYQPKPERVEGVKQAVGVSCAEGHTVVLTAYRVPAPSEAGEAGGGDAAEDSDGAEDGAEGESLPPPPTSVPALKTLCELAVARSVDTYNCLEVLMKAESLYCEVLVDYCCEFLTLNLDGVLLQGKESGLEFLRDFVGGGEEGEMEGAEGASWQGGVEAEEADVLTEVDDKGGLADAHKKVSRVLRKLRKKKKKKEGGGKGSELSENIDRYAKMLEIIVEKIGEKGWAKELLEKEVVEVEESKAEVLVVEEKNEEKKGVVEEVVEEVKRIFNCDLCGVKCPDENSLILHTVGRRHKAMEARGRAETPKKAKEGGWTPQKASPPSNFSSLMQEEEEHRVPARKGASSSYGASPGGSSGFSLDMFMTKKAKTPSPAKALGTPWGGRGSERKLSFEEILAQEKKAAASEVRGVEKGGAVWYTERKERADSLALVQLREEEDRQEALMRERELEEHKLVESQMNSEKKRRAKKGKEGKKKGEEGRKRGGSGEGRRKARTATM